MSDNEIRGVAEALVCIDYLVRALEQAVNANLAWQTVTGFEYASLVHDHKLSQFIEQTRKRVGTEIIGHVSTQRFPGLPCDAEAWYYKALEAKIGLAQIGIWYGQQVGPTAQEDTWKHMLKQARFAVPRVGEWGENRREAKLSGRRLSLEVSTWRQSYDCRWDHNLYNCRDQLKGLEAVIRYADGVDFGLGGRGALYHPLVQQTEPGKVATNWACAPQVRTFKNDRFDIWLRDEVLALKVKAILDHVGPTI